MHSTLIRHGSLAVPRRAEAAYEQAKAYLRNDPVTARIFARAEHARHGLHLRLNAHHDDSFEARTATVNWDPYSALRTTSGGRQSPALGLAHELDHATVAPAVRARGEARFDRRFDNAEERRVIRGSEAHAARTLGESARHDHRGRCYHVASPVVAAFGAL